MATLKLRIGGKWVTISGDSSQVLTQANSYTDEQIKAVNSDISDLQTALGNTDDYIDGSFRDGVITEVESKKIKAYLNTLDVTKANLDQRTTQIINNPDLPLSRHDSLLSAKNNFDSKYTSLVNAINDAIADGKTTTDETANVDSKFTDFNGAVSLLVEQLEQALNDITQTKVDSQQFSTTYTNGMKSALNMDVTTTKSNATTAKSDIDNYSSDGIIYDAELTQINSLLTTMDADKTTMNKRYASIHDAGDFTDAQKKTDLENAKTSYDDAYNDLINTINTSLSDQLVDATELTTIDQKFDTYTQALSLLSATAESAIDSIAQVKGDRANANASAYGTALKNTADGIATNLQDSVNTLETNFDNAAIDGTITSTEKSTIQTNLNDIATNKKSYDDQCNAIYNDGLLSTIPKSDLQLAKSNYDFAYSDMYNAVNDAISDNFVSSSEKSDAGVKISTFTSSLSTLKDKLDAAIDYVSQRKADDAEFGQYNYTDQKLVNVDTRLSTAEASISQNATDITLRVTTSEYSTKVSGMQTQIDTNTQEIADTKNNIVYKVEIISSNGLIFKNGNLNTILSGRVIYGQTDVTDTIDAVRFIWTRASADSAGDDAWNAAYGNGVKTLVITSADVDKKADFKLQITS